MKSLIIGFGEVGKGLSKVLDQEYEVYVKDKGSKYLRTYKGKIEECGDPYGIEILHICLPYNDQFISYVQTYQQTFQPKFTVIHSTVPVGTSRQLNATHSPIRGLHPNLESGIRTFTKFIGGEQASLVADYFRRVGLKVCLFDKQENAEALKLFDTEYYRVCIEFAQRVKQYCIENNLSFSDIYRMGNITYNEGYTQLGHPEFVRPVLEPIMKPIGGHCVMQNKELI